MSNLSFITLISYDYKYAFDAIRSYYDIADEIFLGIDEDRITWSGNKFVLDDIECNNFLDEVDTQRKIRVISKNFHGSTRPIDNDTHERRTLSGYCKPGNWIIQIDADEVLLNPKEFVQYLTDNEEVLENCAIKGNWITVFKSFDNQCLVIDADGDTDGRIFIGTKSPNAYTMCRDTNEMAIQTPLRLLHYSWGRSRADLKQKLENWGHSRDFNTTAYLEMWDKVTLDNYQDFKNIHPLHGPHWPKLKLIDVAEVIKKQGDQK